MAKSSNEKNQEQRPIVQMLYESADKYHKTIAAAEYKYFLLGLLFLKYVPDSFDDLHYKIQNKEGEHQFNDKEEPLVSKRTNNNFILCTYKALKNMFNILHNLKIEFISLTH